MDINNESMIVEAITELTQAYLGIQVRLDQITYIIMKMNNATDKQISEVIGKAVPTVDKPDKAVH